MNSIREALIIFGISTLCGGVAFFVHPNAPSLSMDRLEIELESVVELESVLWVDARVDEDFEKAHIEEAIPLNEERWEEMIVDFLEVWNPDVKTIVYCSSQACLRSHEVAKRLSDELGIDNVYALKGGWEKLIEAGLAEGMEE